MQIRSTHRTRSQAPQVAPRQAPDASVMTPGPEDTVSLLGGAGRGALQGGMGGLLATGVIIAGGAIAKLATNSPIDVAEMGVAIVDAASLAVPPAVMAGAAAGAVAGALGSKRSHAQAAALSIGALAGTATIGYAVHAALEALHSMI